MYIVLIWKRLHVQGITLFPFIILQKKEFAQDVVLMNHERIHIRQQLELLVFPFYIWYLSDYFIKLLKFKRHNKAYRSIIFEREAYSCQQDLNYLQKRPLWNFLRF